MNFCKKKGIHISDVVSQQFCFPIFWIHLPKSKRFNKELRKVMMPDVPGMELLRPGMT